MTKVDEISVKSQVDPSVLAPKSDLYPKIWDPSTKKLNANIKLKLKQIAEDFIRGFKHPLKIKDIILTGSIANYNWNQYSDIDLHVLLDFNEIPDEYMEAFKDYFNAKKEIWNKTHNIMIMGHEVEVYIQDINEPHHSTGVYSIMSDQWLKQPEIKKQDINYDDVINRTEGFIEQINKLSQLVAKKDYQKAKIGIDNLKNKIKKYRQAGLEAEGEYSTENMVFKMLRNQGFLEQLSNLKFQAYDSDMGIEEEILRFQETIEEAKKKKKKKGKKDACYYKAKAKYKVWPSAYASGYLVKCRKKKGKIKEELDEELEIDEILLEDLLDEELELDEELIQQIAEQETLDEKKKRKRKTDFSKEKKQGLRGWFSRQGGEGKSKGWVDCNTCRKDKSTGRKKCKSCGRQKGEKRGKYPACRPTPSACTRKGMKNKKSSKQVSWKSKKEE
jgi:hypothetical protein